MGCKNLNNYLIFIQKKKTLLHPLKFHREISAKQMNEMANSIDADQTAPLGRVYSGSALFAKTNLEFSGKRRKPGCTHSNKRKKV